MHATRLLRQVASSLAGVMLAFALGSANAWAAPILDVTDTIIDDDLSGNSIGNADGIADPGETVELYVELTNTGDMAATGIIATLSTSSAFVTFIFNTSSDYPDLAAGAAALNMDDFDFMVAAAAPAGSTLPFDLSIVSDQGTFSRSFTLTVAGGGNGKIAEPATLLVFALGLLGLGMAARRHSWRSRG